MKTSNMANGVKVKAKGKYFKISPKKMRLVADLIRGMDAKKALEYLNFVQKKASPMIKKVLASAVANAEHDFEIDKDNLFIKEIMVNEGPTLKRWKPRAFGRAGRIRKRSSHLEIILEEKVAGKHIIKKKSELKEPEIKLVSEIKKEEQRKKKETEKFPKSFEKQAEKKDLHRKESQIKGLKNIFRRKSI